MNKEQFFEEVLEAVRNQILTAFFAENTIFSVSNNCIFVRDMLYCNYHTPGCVYDEYDKLIHEKYLVQVALLSMAQLFKG